MAQAERDENFVPTLLGVSSDDGVTPVAVYADPTTHRLLIDHAGGSGTVTSVSVVTANGFAGSVANATTTPAITLSTTITGILQGNGTAISAITVGSGLNFAGGTLSATGGGGNVSNTGTPLNNQIAIWTDATTIEGVTGLTYDGTTFATTAMTGTSSLTLGVAAGTTGSVVFNGTTSGSVTLSVADAAGTWTLKLPTTDGNANEFLQTDGSGNTTWAAGSSIPATTITVANEATDTTCFPIFVTAATGDLGPKSNAGLTFNSDTALLTATLLAGTTSVTSASILASSNDSGAIGASGTAFSDLFLASGAVINFNAGNVTLTHSAGILTQNAGELRITSANVGTNADSVPTLSSTSTLTNKTLTSPTITTGSYSGAQTLQENASIALDPAGSADGKYTGITVTAIAGYTQAFGDLVYLAVADSRWELADADAAATAGPVALAMVVVAGTDGNACTLLLQGIIRADAKFPTMTVGATQYVGETAGEIQGSIPTGADNIIRTVGYALTADELYFNPSTDWQVTVA